MLVLGRGTVGDLRACGLDCEVGDVAVAAQALPELSIVLTPEGFRCDLDRSAVAEALPRMADGWSELAIAATRALIERGDLHRAAEVLGALADAMDVSPLVFRHVFDLLNAGEVELVESLVFDEAFEAPEWLREALSGVEGLLWAGCRGYREQVRRAREVQVDLLRQFTGSDPTGADRVPIAQAWSALELYGSWGEPVPEAHELPADLVDRPDALLRCLWALRRARQLMAFGHVREALELLQAAQGLVAGESILGAHLAADRFICRVLAGLPMDGEELRRLRAASHFAHDHNLELLALTVDGYAAAVVAFAGGRVKAREVARLLERSARHPDPFLHAALAIGCSTDAYRRHSFYAALTYVRGLASSVRYLGSSDLTCCAYILETICQGAVGEEPGPLGELDAARPCALGFLPVARTVYGAAQELFDLAQAIDSRAIASLYDDAEPSFAVRVLVGLMARGSSPQANALRGLIPPEWREPVGNLFVDGDADEGPEDAADASTSTFQLVRPSDGAPLLPRVHLGHTLAPKLTLRMLGGFDVYVGEERVTNGYWRRKAGKTLLQALVVAPGHAATRADLCEMIWPDRDYLASRNLLYSVLSATRVALGGEGSGAVYLICEQGKVALNAKYTECDVDLFERRCRDVLSRQGDLPWRLSLCRDLGRQYAGGLYVPSQDVRGEFQARRRSLESLYVDVLVEATGLSLRAGLAKEALWFSKDALEHDPLREDVVACHLRSLAADGRGGELEKAYGRYCARLSDGRFLPPSVRIRDLHEELTRYVREADDPKDESLRAYVEALESAA